MIAFVAHCLKSNVRELEGFLKRMHAYSTLSKQEINMDLVQSVVREILPEGLVPDVGGEIPHVQAAPVTPVEKKMLHIQKAIEPAVQAAPKKPSVDIVGELKAGSGKKE
jgi:hypothetical protein